jgi:hypothetical protein
LEGSKGKMTESRQRDCSPRRRFIAFSVAVLFVAVGVKFLSSRGVHHAGLSDRDFMEIRQLIDKAALPEMKWMPDFSIASLRRLPKLIRLKMDARICELTLEPDGSVIVRIKSSIWGRTTFTLRKRAGRWHIEPNGVMIL